MKIGIIGSGYIGSTLARLWVQAGHNVIVSSRHPENLVALAKELGPLATVGTALEAARFGDVVLLSIPLGEIPKLSPHIVKALSGKIVMDTCNPFIHRDGQFGAEAIHHAQGSGVWASKHIPGAIIVKAFNSVWYKLMVDEAHRKGDPVGIPLASDDKNALQVVSKLVSDAGLGPVIVGNLARAKDFDVGTLPYDSSASVTELKKMLHLV